MSRNKLNMHKTGFDQEKIYPDLVGENDLPKCMYILNPPNDQRLQIVPISLSLLYCRQYSAGYWRNS